MKLSDRVAAVTGASGGIGRAVALAFAREGADVAVHYHSSPDPAEDVAERIAELGRQSFTVRADVSDEGSVGQLVRSVSERFGRIDIWANIAGYDILTGEGAKLSDVEKLDRVLAVDLRGTVLCSWEAAEVMRRHEGGVIINTSWDQALTGLAGRDAELYAGVKGGILSFSKALARSLAPEIRVNVLAPGWITTEFHETLDDGARERIAKSIDLKRWGTPDDVARAAVFLASPDAAYLTGQTLLVGGGNVM